MSALPADPPGGGPGAARPAIEAPSVPESRFDRLRSRAGLVVAPLAFVLVLSLSFPSLSTEAHKLAAVMAAVVVLWISEAIPLPVTALLGVSAAVVLQVAPAKTAFAPFADPIMFLFIGSFILARSIVLHGLDRRFAFAVLSWRVVGARPSRILFAYGAVTAFISAWISNTATTAMMYSIGLSILAFLADARGGSAALDRRFATGLLLMTSFAASVGGLATPIGTPPNLIGLGFLRKETGTELPFLAWMGLGIPVVVVLYAFLYFLLDRSSARGLREVLGADVMLRRERGRLGAMTPGQWSTLLACAVTVLLWVSPGILALTAGTESEAYKLLGRCVPEGVAALAGACLLFFLPGGNGKRTITWADAAKIDWGVVLLYGGGFALGVLSGETGLAAALGRALTDLVPGHSGIGLLAGATLVAALTSEATSNTAAANIIIPVVIAIAKASGLDPVPPAIGATFGSSLGFMLPVSTPCNAIIYGSGRVSLLAMVRHGFFLDVVGVVVVVIAVHCLVPLVR